MENATKALYMAAGVLMGVMVLSLAVLLYSNLQNYVENSQEQARFTETTSFNTQFTNYISDTHELTIQDIVTVAGLAYENNVSYNTETSAWIESPNSLYVAVYLDGERLDLDIQSKMVELLEKNPEKRYKCSSENVIYSNETGRVYKISFSEE